MAFYLRLALALAVTSFLLAPAPALADSIPPSIAVTLDGTVIGNPVATLDQATGHWIIENYYYYGPEAQITMNLEFDPDPTISYGMAVIDFGAPSVFGFIFGQAILPTAAPGIVTHSESSSTTNGSCADTSVTALLSPAGSAVDGCL